MSLRYVLHAAASRGSKLQGHLYCRLTRWYMCGLRHAFQESARFVATHGEDFAQQLRAKFMGDAHFQFLFCEVNGTTTTLANCQRLLRR